MATVNNWQGSTNNYDTGGNWSGGAKPAATEKIGFFANAQSITTGQTDEQAVNLGGIYIDPTYTGAIGSTGNAWRVGMGAAGTVWHRGAGALYLKAGTAFSSDIIVIDCTTKDVITELDCTDIAVSLLVVLRGNVSLIGGSAATKFNRIEVGYRDNPLDDASLTISSTVTSGAIDVLTMTGGKVTSSEAITTCVCGGGTFTHLGGLISTLDMQGGRFNANWSNTTSDIITQVHGKAGVFDMTQTGGQKVVGLLTQHSDLSVLRCDDDDIHKLTKYFDLRIRP